MKIEDIVSHSLILAICFAWSTDAVAPRRTRFRASSLASKARQGQGLFPGFPQVAYRPTLSSPFVPSITKCCKIGETSAKKKISCSAADHLESKDANRMGMAGAPSQMQKYAKVLLYKAEKCADSKYAGNYEKCCLYRQRFFKLFKECSTLKRGAERRACRDRVRMRFAA